MTRPNCDRQGMICPCAEWADKAEGIIRDFLQSYLASFGGNKDDLVQRAERLLDGVDYLSPRDRQTRRAIGPSHR